VGKTRGKTAKIVSINLAMVLLSVSALTAGYTVPASTQKEEQTPIVTEPILIAALMAVIDDRGKAVELTKEVSEEQTCRGGSSHHRCYTCFS
jgi:hypothetical protein